MQREIACLIIELCLRWVLHSFSPNDSLSVLRAKSREELLRSADKFEKETLERDTEFIIG